MRLLLALLLLSASMLAYELALMRAFSLSLWHHFAYMVISIALLGFGASGTFLAFFRPREPEKAFAVFTTLYALSLPFCFLAGQSIPFDPFLVLWSPQQLLALGAYYLVFFVPFFLAAVAIGLLLLDRAADAPRVYFFNLLGSGAGSLLLVVFLYLVSPERAVLLIYVVAATAALLVLPIFRPGSRVLLLVALVGIFYAFHFTDALHVRPSQYKGLSTALTLPGAELIEQKFSPLGRVDLVRSPAFRHAPGLSLAARATPPEQLALFVDAESAGAITQFNGHPEPLEFLDWTSTAAPYHLLADSSSSRVLILGAGGGGDVLLALYHGSSQVDAVELNPQIVALVRDDFAGFAGNLYSLPQVFLHIQEARGVVESLPEETAFDVIQLSLLDSLATATAGVHALNESYLYTVEAFNAYVNHLTPNGIVSITRWLTMPPRDSLKLFATAVEALEARGVTRPGRQVALIRSWATATLLVKRTPFSEEEIAALKEFCEERLFDLAYYPGIKPEEANRFTQLERPYYYEAARDILARPERRAAFFADYPFNLRPARDDQPYFNHFFRWSALPLLLRTYGRQWLPFLEWGYLMLIATLAQAAVISVVLILLPLLFRRGRDPLRARADSAPSRLSVLAYFLAIGLGFLFVEIVLIQKLTLFLANPIYAVAVVLTGVLVFSGLGSLASARIQGPAGLARACVGVALFAAGAAYLLTPILRVFLGQPGFVRVLLALALMAPLAFLMGMPFPLAWQRLEATRAALLPWAWGVNGCASVLSAILATLLAMSFGFRTVLLTAAALYLIAALTAPLPQTRNDQA